MEESQGASDSPQSLSHRIQVTGAVLRVLTGAVRGLRVLGYLLGKAGLKALAMAFPSGSVSRTFSGWEGF